MSGKTCEICEQILITAADKALLMESSLKNGLVCDNLEGRKDFILFF
jgi:hypothetical protein